MRINDKRKFVLIVKNTFGSPIVHVDNGEKETELPISDYTFSETTDIFWISEGSVLKTFTGNAKSFSIYKNGVAVDISNQTTANFVSWFGGFTAGDCVLMTFGG